MFNETQPGLPESMTGIPVAAALSWNLTKVIALEAEFCGVVPVEQSIKLADIGEVDRKMPGVITFQGAILAALPIEGSRWRPYLAAGAGALALQSSQDANRVPRLQDSQTVFAVNFGAGASFDCGQRWAMRADFREMAAFPGDNAAGLSAAGNADAIWMERALVGLSYRF